MLMMVAMKIFVMTWLEWNEWLHFLIAIVLVGRRRSYFDSISKRWADCWWINAEGLIPKHIVFVCRSKPLLSSGGMERKRKLEFVWQFSCDFKAVQLHHDHIFSVVRKKPKNISQVFLLLFLRVHSSIHPFIHPFSHLLYPHKARKRPGAYPSHFRAESGE